MAELSDEEVVDIQLSAVIGKPILLRPSVLLRQKLQAEAGAQSRSLNNLVIVILERYFKAKHPRLPIANEADRAK